MGVARKSFAGTVKNNLPNEGKFPLGSVVRSTVWHLIANSSSVKETELSHSTKGIGPFLDTDGRVVHMARIDLDIVVQGEEL